MSYYGVAFPRYWTGPTGRAIRRRGGKDAQLLGAYLLFNDHMNMLGLYHLRMRDVQADLQVSAAAVLKAFAVTAEEEYAFYDPSSEFVWVREMARFRLTIRDEKPLTRDDKKAIGARNLYESLPSNPFLGPFFDRYVKQLHLKTRRNFTPPLDIGASKGTSSGFEGASKGLRRGFEASNRSVSVTETVDQKDKSSGADAPRTPPVENPTDNVGVITKIAHEVIDSVGFAVDKPGQAIRLRVDVDSVDEAIKALCARRRIAYNSAVVTAALQSAMHQKAAKAS